MKTRTVATLLLVLILMTTYVPLIAADDLPTLTVMMHDNGRTWDPNTSNNVKIQEVIGAKLDVAVVKEDVITLSFASGDLADVMELPYLTFAEYINTGYILPIDELLTEHGQEILNLTTPFAKELCTVDGVMYGYPYENNNAKYLTYMRKDWLDNLGFDLTQYEQLPDSDIYNIPLDDYVKMMEAFTFNDPDGNGVNDTFGLSTYTESNEAVMFMAFYGAFGGVLQQYYEKDGLAWAYETTDDYRDALKCLNDLWNKGVIDPEIFILGKDQAKSNLMNGKSGSFVGWWSTAYELVRDGMRDLQPTVEWISAEIIGPDGKVGMKDNGRITNVTCITTSCKDPEFAMQVLNKLNEESVWWMIRYGIEGEHYTRDKDGYPARTEIGQKLFEGMTLDTLYNLTNCIDIENFANSAPQTDYNLSLRRSMFVHQFVKDIPLYTNLFYGLPQTQESMDFGVDVASTVKTANMQFITGEVELNDQTWADYIKKWQSMGGSEILASYVDAYNALNNTSIKPAL